MSDAAAIDRAVALLRAGHLVAFPTETVYGLGADATNPAAVAKIFATKGRPADHPLIVHLAATEHLDAWARDVPAAARQLAAAFWPGPLTLILKRATRVPDAVTGGQDTVGLRVPRQSLALALLQRFATNDSGGIAAPSANRFGRISPTTAAHVRAEFGDAVQLVLDGGPCEIGIESTIIDLTRGTPVILRPGAITAADIARVLGAAPSAAATGAAPRVSGSMAAHYAPRTPLQLVSTATLADEVTRLLGGSQRIVVLARQPAPVVDANLHWHQLPQQAAAYAHALYAELRGADAMGADAILLETPPNHPAWLAVADRLRRAAFGSSEEIDP